MTSVLTEDWSGYVENTQVQTITDWGVYGSSANIQAAPKVNASSQIKVDADVGGVCYYSAGSPSHYMEAVVAVQSSGEFLELGPAVGVSARLNWFSVQARSTTTTGIIYRNGGGTVLLTSYTSTPVVIGDLVRLELNNDNETVELFINGVSAGTPVSITGLYTPTNFVGFVAFSVKDPLMGAIELGTLASVPVTNTPPVANAGADQIDIAASATVTLNGTASSDADGTIASYTWTQTAGDTVTLSSASVVSPTFTAPTTIANQTLTFSLVVTDDVGAASTPDTVDISVLAEVGTSSNAVVLIAGLANGTYPVKIWSEVTNGLMYSGDATFSSESASVSVASAVGVAFTGRRLGANPPTTGTGFYGVTS